MTKVLAGVRVIRAGIVESLHRASIVVVQNCKILFSCGNIDQLISMRSSAKPFIAIPFIEEGLHLKYGIEKDELCLMMSSHNGEELHRNKVKSILDKGGLTVDDLNCGYHLPYYEWLLPEYVAESNEKKKQLFHNCSGKHAGMLIYAKDKGFDLKSYFSRNSLLQQLIEERIKKYMGICSNDDFKVGIDGCGVPNYCVSLKKLALAYQNFGVTTETECLRTAILENPYMIAGKERIETEMIAQYQYIAKSGSEGVFCVSIPDQNVGIAIKIESGNDEAAESMVVEIMVKLDFLPKNTKLNKYRYFSIYTSTGIKTGFYEPFIFEEN